MSLRRLPPGTVVAGKYNVLDRLGGGGMGEVYRAEHQLAGRTVALKLLRADFAEDANLTKRFFMEAQAANKIRHPNIVDVLDAGFSEHGPYVVMECLEGMSLSAAIARVGKLSQTTALSVVLPMLDALDAAHRVGIVHRDLKPENVFLSRPHGQRDVRIKLLDFGIAKVLDAPEASNSPRTHTGVVFGTPDYLSPEQAMGDAVVDGRSDVFAVGIVLFELLTAKRPFEAQNAMATAYRIVHTPAPALATYGVQVDPHVQTALDIALAKSKEQRFGTAGALADMLAIVAADGATRREVLSSLLEQALATPSALDATERPPPEEDGRSALAESVMAPLSAGAIERAHVPEPAHPVAEARLPSVGTAPTLLSNSPVVRPEANLPRPAPAVPLVPRAVPLERSAPRATASPPRSQSDPTSSPSTRSAPRALSTAASTWTHPVDTPDRPLPRDVQAWSPRPLPRHVAGRCHTRGSLIRAVGRWIERAHGAAGKSETFALVPREIAETFRADGYNALVWYDLATLDTFMQAATAAVMRGEVVQWRTLARENFERDLLSIFRPSQRVTHPEALLKRGVAGWGKLLDFGTMRVGEAQGNKLPLKFEGFDGASLALRYVTVGTTEGMLRTAGFAGVNVRLVGGEISFARDLELEVSWHPR
jgi:serine/threonine protein kinase